MCLSSSEYVSIFCVFITGFVSILIAYFNNRDYSKRKYEKRQEAVRDALLLLDSYCSWLSFDSGVEPVRGPIIQAKEAKSLRKDLASVKSELEVHKSKTEKSLSEKDIELNSANEKISELRGSINTLTQAHETAKQTMQNQHQKEMDDAQKKIESLKKELDNTTGLHAFMKHRRKKIAWRVFWVVLVLGLIAWFILSSPNCNEPMGWLLKWIEGLDETRKFFIRGTLLFLVSLVLVPLCISLWNTYHSKYGESKKEK